MALKAYGLNKCSTCQNALEYLAGKKVAIDFSDYAVDKPSKEQVAKWIKAVGGWEKLINRAGYTWRGLPEADKTDVTDAKAVKLALAHTSLIRRPLIEHKDGSVTVGFTAKVKELF
jgi:arsenate reductase (glutaredoxin)